MVKASWLAACDGGSSHRGGLCQPSRRLHCRGGSRCRDTGMVHLPATLSNDVVAPKIGKIPIKGGHSVQLSATKGSAPS